MIKKLAKYVRCRRCGRKVPDNRDSDYCSANCLNVSKTISRLSTKLIKEIYMNVSNETIFSDEDLGSKLRSEEFKNKFKEVLFIQEDSKVL